MKSKTDLPTELSVKTFCEWWKENKRFLNSRKTPRDKAYAELSAEVEDFISNYN